MLAVLAGADRLFQYGLATNFLSLSPVLNHPVSNSPAILNLSGANRHNFGGLSMVSQHVKTDSGRGKQPCTILWAWDWYRCPAGLLAILGSGFRAKVYVIPYVSWWTQFAQEMGLATTCFSSICHSTSSQKWRFLWWLFLLLAMAKVLTLAFH